MDPPLPATAEQNMGAEGRDLTVEEEVKEGRRARFSGNFAVTLVSRTADAFLYAVKLGRDARACV